MMKIPLELILIHIVDENICYKDDDEYFVKLQCPGRWLSPAH